ncbi:MAG: hypothetical protein RL563_707 [Pseudomonadota bacterium]|jgi:ABC-type uncharacterized transport system permease subunit
MNPIVPGIFSALCYLAASLLMTRELISRRQHHPITLGFAWLGAIAHGCYVLLIFFMQYQGLNFSFFNTSVLIAFVIVLLLLFATIDKPVEKLGIGLFPLAASLIFVDMIFPEKSHPLATHHWQMNLHILSSIIAFSLLNIAALQALLLALQEQQLRRHQPKRLMLALPPLQAMETLLFQMLGTGIVFLTIALFSGFLFIENLFAQHLAHKTVLSICAWLIFTSLLVGRIRYGWRGKTAIKWTLIGFVLLLLAYFGSKFVLELILQKT